jgi:hypothetical protein
MTSFFLKMVAIRAKKRSVRNRPNNHKLDLSCIEVSKPKSFSIASYLKKLKYKRLTLIFTTVINASWNSYFIIT